MSNGGEKEEKLAMNPGPDGEERVESASAVPEGEERAEHGSKLDGERSEEASERLK